MLLRDARENDAYMAKPRVIAVPQALETVEFDQSLTAVSQRSHSGLTADGSLNAVHIKVPNSSIDQQDH